MLSLLSVFKEISADYLPLGREDRRDNSYKKNFLRGDNSLISLGTLLIFVDTLYESCIFKEVFCKIYVI